MKKDFLKAGFLFLITVGAVFWALNYLFLSGKTAQKSKASGETVELSYGSSTVTRAVNSDIWVMVKIKPTKQLALRGYYAKFKFDPKILQIKSINYLVGVVSNGLGDTNGTISSVNANGIIDIYGEIQNSTGQIFSANQKADLVKLVFTVKSATGTTIDGLNGYFYWQTEQGLIDRFQDLELPDVTVNGGSTSAICTSFSDSFPAAAAVDDSKWDFTTDNQGTITITNNSLLITAPSSSDGTYKSTRITSKKKNIAGDFTVETTMPSLVVLKALDGSTSTESADYYARLGFFGSDPYDGFAIERDNNGKIRALYDWNGSNWTTPQVADTSLSSTSEIKFKMQRNGAVLKLYYDLLDGAGFRLLKVYNSGYSGTGMVVLSVDNKTTNLNVAGRFDDFKLNCESVDVTPTPISTASGNTKLTLKLKFQGIGSKPADSLNSMAVKLKVKGGDLKSDIERTATFTSDASGVWSGLTGFDLPSSGKKYTIYVKGPRHVQKKICDSAPSETAGGTYKCSDENIILSPGSHSLDFSELTLLSGDIYGPNKVQDAVVNSVDISYVRNNLRETESSVLSVCDINLDGKCDTQDFSLIISSLSVKNDEL